MTCREKLKMEHPEYISETWSGGCFLCPSNYEYLPNPEYCNDPDSEYDACERCWDREISKNEKEMKEENPHILDSGARREFESGAVRDIQEGKGRCDLLPLDVVSVLCDDDGKEAIAILDEIHKFQNDGGVGHLFGALDRFAVRYFEAATMGGACCTMALEVSIHFEEGAKKYGENNWQKGIPVHCYIDSAVRHYLKFLRGDKDEPHDRAFCWNLMCAIWTCKNKPELNEYRYEEEED